MANTVICKQIGNKIGNDMANLIFQFTGDKQAWDQCFAWRHLIENGFGYGIWYKSLYKASGGKGVRLTHYICEEWTYWAISLPLTEDNIKWAQAERALVRVQGNANQQLRVSHFYRKLKQVNLRDRDQRNKVIKTTLGVDNLTIEFQRGICRHETLREFVEKQIKVEDAYGASVAPQ